MVDNRLGRPVREREDIAVERQRIETQSRSCRATYRGRQTHQIIMFLKVDRVAAFRLFDLQNVVLKRARSM